MKNSKSSKMFDSDGEIMTTRSNREVTSLKLKKIKGKKEENEINNNSVDSDIGQNPKVLKIYKKFKKQDMLYSTERVINVLFIRVY